MAGGKTRYVILGLLSEGPLTGYEIKRLIDVRFRFFWSESYGQLYPELKQLEADGLLSTTETTGDPSGQANGRRRTRHAITPAGREALRHWLAEPVDKESLRLELLLKMYFSSETSAKTMQNHLHTFKREHLEQLHLLNLFHDELTRMPDPDGNHGDILQVIEFGRMINHAFLTWAEQTIDYLSERDRSRENPHGKTDEGQQERMTP